MKTSHGDIIRQAIADERIQRCTITEEWVICTVCRGSGGHSNRFGAFSAQEWDEQDDEFQTGYMSGAYDENCDTCDGTGKTFEIVWNQLSREAWDYLYAYLEDEYETAALERAERWAGC